jgi:hypothetical protein
MHARRQCDRHYRVPSNSQDQLGEAHRNHTRAAAHDDRCPPRSHDLRFRSNEYLASRPDVVILVTEDAAPALRAPALTSARANQPGLVVMALFRRSFKDSLTLCDEFSPSFFCAYQRIRTNLRATYGSTDTTPASGGPRVYQDLDPNGSNLYLY